MKRRRRLSTDTSGATSRRQVLLALGGSGLVGLGANAMWTNAFASVTAARNSTINTTTGSDAYVGLEVYNPIGKNSRDPLVDVTNNFEDGASITVSLNTCTDGTLYGPDGDSGCSVSFSLSPGNTQLVEIEAAVKDTSVPFTVDAETAFAAVSATRETYAEAGNAKGAVTIQKIKDFLADEKKDEWTIKQVHVKADNELDHVEYEVRDSAGAVVASRTDEASGTQYKRNNPTIQPDDSGYDVPPGESYTLKVTAYDVLDNYASDTRSTTA